MSGIGQIDRLRNTFWAHESSFGTAPGSPQQIWPQGVVEDGRAQTEIEQDDETVYLNDVKPTILGLKEGGCKLTLACRPPAVQLTASATGGALTTAPNHEGLLGLFGGEQILAGSLVATGTSSTIIVVTAGQGVRFTAGQAILVGVAGVLYLTIIASIATDTLTLALALPGTPATGQLVLNLHHYFLDDANVGSVYLRDIVTAPGNDEQLEYLGCVGDVQFSYDRNSLLKLAFDLKAGNWNGPGSLGFAAPAFAADPQGGSFAEVGAITLLQAVATTTTLQYPMLKFSAKLTNGMMHREELGGINGRTGTMRGGPKLAGEFSFQVERDTQVEGWRINKTPLRCLHAVFQGAGATARVAGLHAPNVLITGVEKISGVGERRMYEVKGRTLMNTALGTKLGRAPWIYFNG